MSCGGGAKGVAGKTEGKFNKEQRALVLGRYHLFFRPLLETSRNKRARLQLLKAVGWRPATIKGARLQLLKTVGWRPTAIKGLDCSYLRL